jgi:hypothetical protein
VLLQKLDAHLEQNAPPAWMLASFDGSIVKRRV